MQCPHCNFENESISTYCERCGAPLQNVTQEEVQEQTEYQAPPPPPLNGHNPPPPPPSYNYYDAPPQNEYSTPPPYTHNWGTMSPPSYSGQKVQPEPRHIGVFSGILYFPGVFIVLFGTFAVLVTFGSSALIGLIGIILSFVLFVASIVLFVRLVRRRITSLRWWQRILWLTVLTVGAFILLIIAVLVSPSKTITNYVLSCVILFYGLAWCAVAVW